MDFSWQDFDGHCHECKMGINGRSVRAWQQRNSLASVDSTRSCKATCCKSVSRELSTVK